MTLSLFLSAFIYTDYNYTVLVRASTLPWIHRARAPGRGGNKAHPGVIPDSPQNPYMGLSDDIPPPDELGEPTPRYLLTYLHHHGLGAEAPRMATQYHGLSDRWFYR
jgi:hypothetical protein